MVYYRRLKWGNWYTAAFGDCLEVGTCKARINCKSKARDLSSQTRACGKA